MQALQTDLLKESLGFETNTLHLIDCRWIFLQQRILPNNLSIIWLSQLKRPKIATAQVINSLIFPLFQPPEKTENVKFMT